MRRMISSLRMSCEGREQDGTVRREEKNENEGLKEPTKRHKHALARTLSMALARSRWATGDMGLAIKRPGTGLGGTGTTHYSSATIQNPEIIRNQFDMATGKEVQGIRIISRRRGWVYHADQKRQSNRQRGTYEAPFWVLSE